MSVSDTTDYTGVKKSPAVLIVEQAARIARLEMALEEMLREYRDAPFDVVRRARATLKGCDE